MPIHHISIPPLAPEIFQKTLDFYLGSLAPLGYKQLMSIDTSAGRYVGLGSGKPDLWLVECNTVPKPELSTVTITSSKEVGQEEGKKTRIHIGFATDKRSEVRKFYSEGLKAGGVDNGSPGLRPYTPTYYAAFLFDPVGNNIEVVCTEEKDDEE